MSSIETGAKQAIFNCLKVKEGEKVIIITDLETKIIAGTFAHQARLAGGEVQLFLMEDFGARPLDGKKPLSFPDEIKQALSSSQVSLFVAQSRKGELASFRFPMIASTEKYMVRHAHMISITEEIMCRGMSADHVNIQRLNKKILELFIHSGRVHVTTPAGTDFTAIFDRKYKWINFDGDIKPGEWQNLPGGEILTCPADVNGVVVIDGCFGDLLDKRYGDISKTPLFYALKDGRCVKGSVTCENNDLKRDFERYTFDTDENSDRAGEFAIGTNIELTSFIGVLLQDEKFPGVHLALGDPFPSRTGAEWKSAAHNDGVMRNPTVTVDDRTIMVDGTFTMLEDVV